jgi:hypothetical protein
MTATVDNKSAPKKVDINEAHALFGHLLIKMTDHVASKKVGEILFLDVAAVMQNQNSDASVDSTSKRYRQIMVNEASQ